MHHRHMNAMLRFFCARYLQVQNTHSALSPKHSDVLQEKTHNSTAQYFFATCIFPTSDHLKL